MWAERKVIQHNTNQTVTGTKDSTRITHSISTTANATPNQHTQIIQQTHGVQTHPRPAQTTTRIPSVKHLNQNQQATFQTQQTTQQTNQHHRH